MATALLGLAFSLASAALVSRVASGSPSFAAGPRPTVVLVQSAEQPAGNGSQAGDEQAAAVDELRLANSELEALRQQIANGQARQEEAEAVQQEVARGLDQASQSLRALNQELSLGNVGDADAVLDNALLAARSADLRNAPGTLAAAQTDIANGNLFAARMLIAAAISGIDAQRSPPPR